MKVSKKWLQEYFASPLPDTEELVRRITFGIFEVEEVMRVGDDDVLDVKVLPDRSSYCLSHRGIAREIATLLDVLFKKDPLREPLPQWQESKLLAVKVEDAKLCPRYMGAVMRDVTIGPSPEWLKKALETLGQRSINNIVDATNYVMYNLGQPLHAFDLKKLETTDDVASIVVRQAKEGEKITVLTGETYELDTHDLLITDGESEKPLAVAGIKGGKQAEIDADTKDIVLEAANFNYVSVRKTSRKLKLVTDASVRFQNEPSPELVGYAMQSVVALIEKIAGGNLEGVVDVYAKPPASHAVTVTLNDIQSLLGATIAEQEVSDIFSRLGFEYKKDGGTFTVTPPFERTDLTIKEDLIEEVGRVYGYENIKAVLPLVPKEKPALNKNFYYAQKVRKVLVGLGFSEVYTYTLRSKGEVELENPLASDKAFMRASLADGIRESLELNAHSAPLLGLDAVKIFEIGTVFKKEGEHMSLALGVKHKKAKEILEQALNILKQVLPDMQGDTENYVIEINFDQAIQVLPVPEAYELLSERALKTYQPFSSYPFVLRDIALWVPENIEQKEIIDLITQQAGDLLVRVDLFDTFKKEERISYAFHLVFQSKTKTLTDVEVGEVMNSIVNQMQQEGWEVR